MRWPDNAESELAATGRHFFLGGLSVLATHGRILELFVMIFP